MAKEKCDKNCATCSSDNRSFCAVQMAMANQELILALTQKIDNMVETDNTLLLPIANDNVEPTDPGTATINSVGV